MYIDGYKYWLAYTKGDKSYYRCFRSKTIKCPGKIIFENGKVKNLHQHSHDKETKISIVDKFRKVLTKKAVEKPTKPLVEIYLEETLNFTEASILYPFQSAESTMRKARRKNKPRPNKLNDSANDTNQQELEVHNQLQKHYCQENLPHDGSTVIFMHQYSLKLLGRIEEIHVDCSIACKNGDTACDNLYLITVIAMVKNQDYPIAFGLVKVKSTETFVSFFTSILNKAPAALKPNNILTNCDGNLQDALRIVFPDATIKVMWFLYASSVLKYAKDNGMLSLMNKSLFHLSSLKMILAIPLIPTNYIIVGLDSLKKWMSEKMVSFEGLCNFVDTCWLKSDGAEKISIFNGLSHSINNYVQNFNRNLLQNLNAESLTKDQLLEAITKQASRTIKKLNKSKSPQTLKKAQKLQKTILETATHNWIKANIHLRRPIQFLQQVSHCIDDSLINFLIHYDSVDKQPQECVVPANLEFSNSLAVKTSSAVSATISSDLPPLIFFQNQRNVPMQTILSLDPPPLVPIIRTSITNTR